MLSQLTNVSRLKTLLATHGVRPRRRASQNFLICDTVVAATVAAASAGPQQITELGAGVGVLTQSLLAAGFFVRAIERDRRLAHLLAEVMPAQLQSRLVLVNRDLRRETWEQPGSYQVVGNIPYQLSGLIIKKITRLMAVPEQAVLLLQKEVGQRLVAAPPQLTLIGLAVQLWGSARILRRVPAACFWPAPQVDSVLVSLTPAPSGQWPALTEREAVLHVAKYFFRMKRKQMGGVLRRRQRISAAAAADLLHQANISSTQRPQEVAVPQWQRLARLLEP
jgi:16S rRNA (adenine1518-N6/adenine1519-N6)-dimethyltransferase